MELCAVALLNNEDVFHAVECGIECFRLDRHQQSWRDEPGFDTAAAGQCDRLAGGARERTPGDDGEIAFPSTVAQWSP